MKHTPPAKHVFFTTPSWGTASLGAPQRGFSGGHTSLLRSQIAPQVQATVQKSAALPAKVASEAHCGTLYPHRSTLASNTRRIDLHKKCSTQHRMF